MNFPERGAACPQLRLIYFTVDGEKRRAGPRYKVSHYIKTHGITTIHINGYTMRGSKTPIVVEREFDLSNASDNITLHDEFWKQLYPLNNN